MHDPHVIAGERTVFATERATVTIAGIINAAHFRGALEPGWKRVLALSELAEEVDDADEGELQALSEQFRVDRDLITAEETERWLDERGLTLDDFGEFFRRHRPNGAPAAPAEEMELDYTSASDDLRERLRIELLLSGEFDQIATQHAWRMAAIEGVESSSAAEAIEAERIRFYERSRVIPATLNDWLGPLGCDRKWFDEMVNLEAVFRRQSDELLSLESRQQMLQSLRVPLTRFELEEVELESRDAAREALLCASEDGLPLAEIAEEGRYPYRRLEIVCEDLPEELQQKFLCAATDEILDPIERGDGFQLCRLLRKNEPTLADDEVGARVEKHLLERHFSELVARHVRWIMQLNSADDAPA
ncbi:MAG: hypothetical protein ABI680_01710 [Chthoniobacteraceae bacterium]